MAASRAFDRNICKGVGISIMRQYSEHFAKKSGFNILLTMGRMQNVPVDLRNL